MKIFIKKIYLILTFLITSYLSFSNSIEGYWMTLEKNKPSQAILKIDQGKDGLFYGKIVYIATSKIGDSPISVITKDPFIGFPLIKSFRKTDDEHYYKGGFVTNPENNKTYYARIRIKDKETMILRGSLDPFGILGLSRAWKRVYLKNFIIRKGDNKL